MSDGSKHTRHMSDGSKHIEASNIISCHRIKRLTNIEKTLILTRTQGDWHRLKEIRVQAPVDYLATPIEQRVKSTWVGE